MRLGLLLPICLCLMVAILDVACRPLNKEDNKSVESRVVENKLLDNKDVENKFLANKIRQKRAVSIVGMIKASKYQNNRKPKSPREILRLA